LGKLLVLLEQYSCGYLSKLLGRLGVKDTPLFYFCIVLRFGKGGFLLDWRRVVGGLGGNID